MNTPRRSSRRSSSLFHKFAKNGKPIAAVAAVVLVGFGAGTYFLTAQDSPANYLEKAISHEQAGDLDAAAIMLKNVLQQEASHAEARFRLGRLHFLKHDYQSAEKELLLAQDHGYAAPELRVLLARTLLKLSEPGKVVDQIDEGIGYPEETNAAILALRAQAHLMLGETDVVERSLNAADAYFPDHPDTLTVRALKALNVNRDPKEAMALVNMALGKSEDRADLWVMKADLLRILTSGQQQEALAAYAKALAIDPANIPARLASAQIHLESNDLDKAEAELKQLGQYASNNVLGRYLSAFIDFRRNRLDDANNKLQSVLGAAPNFLPANLLAGIVNLSLGRQETATQHLGKVLDVAPDHALARKLMSAALLSSDKPDQAKTMLATLKDDDSDALLLSLQGNIALRSGDFEGAKRSLEKAAELAPGNVALMRELAASRLGSGDEPGAVAALTRMAEIEGDTNQAEILLILTHLKAKRGNEAMKIIDALEKKQPNQPLVHNLRGIVHAADEQLDKARTSFLQALKINPGYFPAASNLANLDLAKKDFKAARARFEQVTKHDPNSSRAWLALAELARAENKEADYLANIEKALRVNPKDARARLLLAQYWLGRREAGKALAEARAGLDQTGKPEFHEFIGLAYAQQGDQVNALAAFTKLAELAPNHPQAHFRLAQARIAEKNTAAALRSLDRALQLKPDFLEAAVSKALLLSRENRRDEALKVARELQAQYPKSAHGFLAEAEIRNNAKEHAAAGALYVKAAQLSGQGQALIGAHRAYTMAGKPGEGENALQQWLAKHPQDNVVRHQLASAYLSTKRMRESAEQYETLLRANPSDGVALNNLAWLQGELKDPRAIATAERALKLHPDNPAIQDTLGWLLVNAGQAARGRDLLRKALEKAPDSPDIRWHLVVALDKTGDKSGAVVELDRLLTSGKPFTQREEASRMLRRLRGEDK